MSSLAIVSLSHRIRQKINEGGETNKKTYEHTKLEKQSYESVKMSTSSLCDDNADSKVRHLAITMAVVRLKCCTKLLSYIYCTNTYALKTRPNSTAIGTCTQK